MNVRKSFVLLFIAVSFCLFSCATQVKVIVERPSEFDMKGANSIAVFPIQPKEPKGKGFIAFFVDLKNSQNINTREQLAQYLTNTLTAKLISSSYYKVIDAKSVETALKSGKKAPVDVYLTGVITRMKIKIKDETETNKDGTTTVYYKEDAEVSIAYKITDVKTGEILGMHTVDYSSSSKEDSLSKLPGAYDLLVGDMDSLASKIMREIEPYQVTIYLSLLKDKTKDPLFKEADQYAKNGELQLSYEMFHSIYEQTGCFEAGYNAALLLEALGRLEDARDEMQILLARSGNKKKAYSALRNINKEIIYAEKFKRQQEEKASKS